MSPERRAHPRVELFAQVQVTRESEVHILEMANISRGGAFLQAEPREMPEIQVGVDLELLIFCADDIGQDVACRAKVVRVVDQSHAPRRGFGVAFTAVDPQNMARLERFLPGL